MSLLPLPTSGFTKLRAPSALGIHTPAPSTAATAAVNCKKCKLALDPKVLRIFLECCKETIHRACYPLIDRPCPFRCAESKALKRLPNTMTATERLERESEAKEDLARFLQQSIKTITSTSSLNELLEVFAVIPKRVFADPTTALSGVLRAQRLDPTQTSALKTCHKQTLLINGEWINGLEQIESVINEAPPTLPPSLHLAVVPQTGNDRKTAGTAATQPLAPVELTSETFRRELGARMYVHFHESTFFPSFVELINNYQTMKAFDVQQLITVMKGELNDGWYRFIHQKLNEKKDLLSTLASAVREAIEAFFQEEHARVEREHHEKTRAIESLGREIPVLFARVLKGEETYTLKDFIKHIKDKDPKLDDKEYSIVEFLKTQNLSLEQIKSLLKSSERVDDQNIQAFKDLKKFLDEQHEILRPRRQLVYTYG